MNRRLSILFTTNKALPDNDHRLIYGELSRVCSMTYALPGKPDTLDSSAYTRVNIGEGLRIEYLFHLVRLAAFVARNRTRFDVWHHNSTLPILIGPILSSLVRMPSVITITGFGRLFSEGDSKKPTLRALYMWLLKLSVHLARRVLFQNHGDLAFLSAKFPSVAHKFRYAGSAVEMAVTREKDFSASTLRVLLAARLMPEKGVGEFLQVAKILRGKGLQFILAGPRSVGFDPLFQEIQQYHCQGTIRYVGELNLNSMQAELAQAHIFYLPSSYGEGMARVMLEAGFAQICPLCYDISANRDLIDEGRGFIIQRGDVNSAVGILRALRDDRDMLEKNALNYQKHVLANFTIATFQRRMDAIFREVAFELGIRVD